jgi:TonB family protein
MRFSLIISLLLHLLILCALFFVFRIVPEMNLPSKIYTIKILQPIVGSKRVEPEKKAEVKLEKPEVKKPAPKKPDERKDDENKAPVAKESEKPLDVAVQKDLEGGSAVAVDAPRFPFTYYLEAIERKVSENWFSAVPGGGESLSCMVYFRLKRDGAVKDIRMERSSGNSYFDRAALRAVRSSAPFPPLPRAFRESHLGIHFTFLQKD